MAQGDEDDQVLLWSIIQNTIDQFDIDELVLIYWCVKDEGDLHGNFCKILINGKINS